MFTALGIYTESFEKPFLGGTSEFYAAEGVKYMQQSDVPDYLKHVEVSFVLSSFSCSFMSPTSKSYCVALSVTLFYFLSSFCCVIS